MCARVGERGCHTALIHNCPYFKSPDGLSRQLAPAAQPQCRCLMFPSLPLGLTPPLTFHNPPVLLSYTSGVLSRPPPVNAPFLVTLFSVFPVAAISGDRTPPWRENELKNELFCVRVCSRDVRGHDMVAHHIRCRAS